MLTGTELGVPMDAESGPVFTQRYSRSHSTLAKCGVLISSHDDSKGITLSEGMNHLLNQEVYLKKIKTTWTKETCFILATNMSIDNFNVMNITVKYDELMPEKYIPSLKIQLTSKANSYGLIKSYWPDGEVLTFRFTKFTYQAEVGIVSKKNVFLEEKGQCSNNSFHKTIMLSDDFETCPRKCLPLILPDLNLPLCQNDNETECIVNRIADLTDFSLKKACRTLEFDGKKHILHQIPSGIFRNGKHNVIGNGVVLDPVIFMNEVKSIEEKFKSCLQY